MLQEGSYPSELKSLLLNDNVHKSSSLVPLNPTLNNQSLICAGGRVKNSDILAKSNYQVIVNKDHPIAKLIIKHYHEENLHVGREQTLCSLRLKYWIPTCHGIISSVVTSCLYCKRERIKRAPPFMSDIPEDRLCIDEKPFTNTGVDCLGPYHIKLSKRNRSNQATGKRYVPLFTCLTMRAVHLEIAGDLSTDAFILALRRFISRRGKVNIIRLDKGTNFVGASKELKQAIKNIDQNTANKHLIAKGINWKFNPPVSPWMGGIWESLVKFVKVIIRNKLFTEECLSTFLCELESILNQRLLTPISDDVNDLKALIPSHFIIGSYKNTVPGVFHKQEFDYHRKWRSVQATVDVFWIRWRKEYLPSLNLCKRWTQKITTFMLET